MRIADVYIKFIPYNKEPYYVSFTQYMEEHQDTYQDDHDDVLYKWRDVERQFTPIT